MQIAQKSWRSDNTFKQCQNSSGVLCTPCGGVCSEESVPEAVLSIEERYIFDRERCSSIAVKVPSTNNLDMLVWVKACTGGLGKSAANGVTLRAQGDLRQQHLPIHKRIWSIVPCSQDLPDGVHPGFSKETAFLTRHAEKRESDGHHHGKNTFGLSTSRARTWSKDWPRIRFLVSSLVEEREAVCWMEGSKMEGQQLYQKIHNSVCPEEPLFTRALQGHSGKNLDMSTLTLEKIEKNYAPFLYHVGLSRNEDAIFKLEDLSQDVLERTEAGKQCASNLCRHWVGTPTRSTSRTFIWRIIMTYCLWLIWKWRKIRWNFSNRPTEVSHVTQFQPSSSPRSPTSKMEQKGSRMHNQKKEKHHQRREAGEILEDNKHNKIFVQCKWCNKGIRIGTDVVKKLGGLTDQQEKSPTYDWERFSSH